MVAVAAVPTRDDQADRPLPGMSAARIALGVFLFGAAVRLALASAAPPSNAFDDHFEPIFLMLRAGGEMPRKDACAMCQHPPVFYWSAGMLVRGLIAAGVPQTAIPKALQLAHCLASIAILPFVWLALGRIRTSGFARTTAFGFACLLPRSVYMSSMFANDDLACLFVAIAAWLGLRAIDEDLAPGAALALAAATSLALFTKYTSYVLLPALGLGLLVAATGIARRRRATAGLALALGPPLLLLTAYAASNLATYGAALPARSIAYADVQPHDPGGIEWWSFRPGSFLREPLLVPGQLQSFWTVLWASAWFDVEPKFLNFSEPDIGWWDRYFDWFRGGSFPGLPVPISTGTRLAAVVLLACGLVALALLLAGFIACARRIAAEAVRGARREAAKLVIAPVLVATNLLMIVLIARIVPFFSSLKASYLVPSLPALSILVALGCDGISAKPAGRRGISAVLALLGAALAVHVGWLVAAFLAGRGH